jgi:glyceraldehyde 3-phosphate dehydrogenase
MRTTKVAVNGFGRIGRAFFKLALTKPELEIVAINDLGDLENLAYLLKYDSVYGRYDKEVKAEGGELIVAGKKYKFIQEKDATKLPWKELEVDIVVESTGVFESFEKAKVHIQAGAKKVVLTAPAKDDDEEGCKTVLMGMNDKELEDCALSSNGSCTTNSVTALMQILVDKLGVKKAFLNTIHGYTATQALIDGPTKGHDYRRGRAAAVNITPSTTGAAKTVGKVVPEIKGKFDGMAMRVPVPTGSISAITFLSERPTTAEEINKILRDAEIEGKYEGLFKTTTEQLVSTDIVGESVTAVIDLSLTKVVDGDLCAVYSWYDNEFGYTNTLVMHVLKMAKTI